MFMTKKAEDMLQVIMGKWYMRELKSLRGTYRYNDEFPNVVPRVRQEFWQKVLKNYNVELDNAKTTADVALSLKNAARVFTELATYFAG